MKFILSYLFLLFLCSSYSDAADLPGSKDPGEIKRYEGSEIVRYEQIKFDTYTVPLGKMTNFDFGTKQAEFEKSEKLEGNITRVSYHIPDPLRSSLEVFRNYETDLKNSGWAILWSASGKPEFGRSFSHLYESLKDNDQLFTYNDAQGNVLVGRKEGLGLTAVIFVTKFEMGLTRGIKITKGDPIVQLDLIQTKQMEQKMIVPTSSEMNKSITETGKIALYGILFDYNSTTIKTESEPTLVQIANLLKENSKLKLIVAGHTDNAGSYEFNQELSEKRAKSVVEKLVKSYAVENSRLKAVGVSYASPVATNYTEEGRAKNRRVELVEVATLH